jgi:hypothetical protein
MGGDCRGAAGELTGSRFDRRRAVNGELVAVLAPFIAGAVASLAA